MGGCSFYTRIILVGVLAFAGGVGCQFYERNVPSAAAATATAAAVIEEAQNRWWKFRGM